MIVLTEGIASKRIKSYASSRGGIFHGFVGGKFVTNQTKCILSCEFGHEWNSATYANLINKGSWCPSCRGNKKISNEEAKIRISEYAVSNGGKFINFIGGKYKDNVTICVMECSETHRWESRYGNLVNSRSWCPYCAESGYNYSKEGFLYILVNDEGCMKVGITNSPKKRINCLRSTTPFYFNVLEIFNSTDGLFVSRLERIAHRMCKSAGYKDFDGATEWFVYDGSVVDFIRNILK
ncbi:endonuclease [Escherichia phage PhaxI]|uniref:CapR homology domain-containing protein n=3 Tax=Kuttervirus TaxID=2169536 RepID=G9IIL4_9CAUD|nr:endonuclease [Escherichia phage PhaxI]YP_009880328.1 endonuclease [Escherichia phage EP75]YP_009888130.1 endonuclease [Salmonella phage aagejoakim]AEW24351.1 hypothetical protein [Escherichia phage PhaxI]AVZ45063.1 hypothetical protein [Escherichia phage EP75]QIO02612.1 hypothetical protein aagejoakim_14 [Salmonella phage aagejoakim]